MPSVLAGRFLRLLGQRALVVVQMQRMKLSGHYAGEVVPYQRMTRGGRFTPRAQRYHASQNRLRAEMQRAVATDWPGRAWAILRPQGAFFGTPYSFCLTLYVPATKKGAIPRNKGDVDNYAKAWLDAAQHACIVQGDDLHWLRHLEVRVVLAESWGFGWSFEEWTQ